MSFTHKYRNTRGQALAEGTAAMALLTFVAIGLLLLIVGAGTMMLYQLKVSYAAMTAARIAVDDSTWMGIPRPGYPAGRATTILQNSFNSLLDQMGIDHIKYGATIKMVGSTTSNGISYNQFQASVSGLKILSNGILPNSVPITANVSIPNSGPGGKPPMILGLSVQTAPGSGQWQGFYVPCYGGGMGPWTNINNSWSPGTDWAYAQFTISATGGVMDSNVPHWNWCAGPQFTNYATSYK